MIIAVIPTKNQASWHLSIAISSARALADIVVVVIDGSQEKISRDGIIVIENPPLGIGAALNAGCRVAQPGDKIAFLDSDDFWLPGKKIQFESEYPATFTQFMRNGIIEKCDKPLKQLTKDNIPCRSTTVITKEVYDAVGPVDESLKWCQDWDYHVRVQQKIGWHRIPITAASISDLDKGHTRSAATAERSPYFAKVVKKYRGLILR